MLKVEGRRASVALRANRSRFILNSALVSCAMIAAMSSASVQAKDADADKVSASTANIQDLQFRAQASERQDQARVKTLNVPGTASQSTGVQATAAATPKLAAGQFKKADGSLTTDLEAAAQSWRDDPEFARNPSYALIGAEYAYARGITGAGVKLGVLDSGVGDFQGEFGSRLHLVNTRAALGIPADEVPYEYGAFDGKPLIGFSGEHGHGTHVAGTIGAARNGSGVHGVAYGADIYSATAFLAYDGFVMARNLQLDAQSPGIRALADQGVRVINNSWGGNFVDEDGEQIPVTIDPEEMRQALIETYNGDDKALRDAFRYAVDKGIIMVFANGNSSRGADDENGEIRVHAGVQASAPMALPQLENNWISVAAVDNDRNIVDFSQECGATRFWCVSAPGTDIDSPSFAGRASVEDAKAFAANLSFDILDEDEWAAAQANAQAEFADNRDPSEMARMLVRSWAKGIIEGGAGLDILLPPGRNGTPHLISDNDLLDALGKSGILPYLSLYGVFLEQTGDAGARARVLRLFETAYIEELAKLSPFVAQNYLASGTSMAAPHTTASLGLVMERFNYLNGVQARQVLLTTADDLGDAGVDITYGWGLINIGKAMNGPGAFLTDWNVNMAQGVTDTWSNDITNGSIHTGRDQDHGSLILNGAGNLTLSGNNSFDGITLNGGTLNLTANNVFTKDTLVNGGLFNLSGSLKSPNMRVDGGSAIVTKTGKLVDTNLLIAETSKGPAQVIFNGVQTGGTTLVGANGFLGGNGTLGTTTVRGTISPGESIGTLTINGDYTQAAGSTFVVEMTPPSQVDQVNVTGKAKIEGGTVVAHMRPGVFALGQKYKFLTAAGGVTGTFSGLTSTQPTPFLKLGLTYEPTLVSLDVKRGATLASAASTTNQSAVAAAADGSPDTNLVLQSLVLLPNAATAQAAFDSLSGEVYASAQNGMLSATRHTRDTALSHAATAGAKSAEDSGTWVWVDGISGSGEIEGNGNFGTLDTRNSGMFLGIDQQFTNNFLLGGFVGWGKDKFRVDERRSSANADVMNFGLYAGKNWGGLGLRIGGTYSTYDFRANRHVIFPGVDQKLESEFDAKSYQLFAEAGYAFGGKSFNIEPFVRYAKVWTKSDALDESGGFTALSVAKRETNTDLGIFGARGEVALIQPEEGKMGLQLQAAVSRQQVLNGFDGRNALMVAAWDGGDPFIIQGAAYPKSATNVDASLVANISNRARVQVGYNGQFTSRGNNNGINARFSIKF